MYTSPAHSSVVIDLTHPTRNSLDELADGQQDGRGRVDSGGRGGGALGRGLWPTGQGASHALAARPPPAVRAARIRGRGDGTVVTGPGGGGGGGRDVRGGRGVPGAPCLAQQQRLERVPEVLQVIGVQQRVAGRVEVRQDDARVQQRRRHGTLVAERLHAVDGVQRHPADGEERHDYRQVLRGLHLALPGRAQHAQFRLAVSAASAAVQQRHLFDLKPTVCFFNACLNNITDYTHVHTI